MKPFAHLVCLLVVFALAGETAVSMDLGGKLRLPSDVIPIRAETADALLKNECRGPIIWEEAGCYCDRRGEEKGSVRERLSAKGVVYGHFLSPTSEDALVSGDAGESRPEGSGGSLLLTKKENEWVPVWYKSAIISRYCRRVQLETGRHILLCENEDGGMGHRYHDLFVLDPLAPADWRDSALLTADSFVDQCHEDQRQSIERIVAPRQLQHGRVGLTVYARSGRQILKGSRRKACIENRPIPPPAMRSYKLDFVFDGARFQIAPWSTDGATAFR
jgi:hypothetical protein